MSSPAWLPIDRTAMYFPPMASIGQKIKEARKRRGYSQRKLASLMHVSTQAISQWENEVTNINSKHLKPLAYILNVSENFFINAFDGSYTPPSDNRMIPVIKLHYASLFLHESLSDRFDKYVYSDDKLLSNHAYAITVDEAPKEPGVIEKGDLLIFDPKGDKIENGDLVVAIIYQPAPSKDDPHAAIMQVAICIAREHGGIETFGRGGVERFGKGLPYTLVPLVPSAFISKPNGAFPLAVMVERRQYRNRTSSGT